ncbi:MAG TPA: U32 family peptidase [Candidatus Hydrogenedentes bacterium]|nr:U32 family peptidase [Candidatus Hydrogenedentota bacterium]
MMENTNKNQSILEKDQLELLAPAKDAECGIAAIQCGADAVYIGANRFGARENAANTLDDIERLVHQAHLYWARVYVTINTLLRDDEISQAQKLAWQLHEIGVDGLIIQDTALLELDLPPLPLIASTQMHTNTPEKVAFLDAVGFQRAILARELDLRQIRAIRKAAGHIELECFIHGALCVCYSGQCYLSYAIGGRSGNRGQCAQPCRKRYTLTDANGQILQCGKHLLSLRDLNLSGSLNELIDAGITSFKIEGRLKDKAYVANAVAWYRARLDAIMKDSGLHRSSSGVSNIGFTPDITKTFHRGFSEYFLNGRTGKIGSLDTPKMMGEPLGPVTKIKGSKITVDTKALLHSGDGICFLTSEGELQGSTINSASANTIVPDKPEGIAQGAFLYRNHDHVFLTQLNKSRMERHISVSLSLRRVKETLTLSAHDNDGVSASISIEHPKTPAEKPDLARDTIKKQLSKTGNTPYQCDAVEVEISETGFLPQSVLNNLRRTVLDALSKARRAQHPRKTGGIIPNDVPYPETTLSYRGNVLNHAAEAFYLRHGVTQIEPAAESGLNMTGRTVMTTRYCIKYELGLCPRENKSAVLAEPLILTGEEGDRLQLRFHCNQCHMEIILLE